MTEGKYMVSMDLGGVRFKTDCDTLALAREAVDSMDPPEGYSSHSATIYVWAARAVDGKICLRTVERYWFGHRVYDTPESAPAYTPVSPVKDLLDSDGPDYDPEAYLAALNV